MKKLKVIIGALLIGGVVFSCSNSDGDNNDLTCEEAAAITADAATEYAAATNANFVEMCNAYKVALEAQIDVCGDPSGNLQALADGLDCTEPSTSTGTLSMSLGSAPLSFDVITVTTTGTTRHVHGEKSNTTSYAIDFDIEVGQTGVDKINNFELRLFSHTYTPMIPSAFGNDWSSNITVNSATSVVGTFHGELESATATNVQDLLNGVVNINF